MCSEAAFETTNSKETMERSASIQLQKGKYLWPQLSDTSKRRKEVFLTKASILSDNLKTFAFLLVLDVMVLGSTRNNASAFKTKLHKLNFVVFDFTQ